MKYDIIIVGAGFAGATLAERFANDLQKKVLLIDKRSHIGGNMYDFKDENGILIHQYGPHLFHTNIEKVYRYLMQFGSWFAYEHRVLGKVGGKLVPIPFNLTSILESFPKEKAEKLIHILKSEFGEEKKIPILELRKHKDKDINELAEYIYENVFLYYTMKQWDQKPEEISPFVTNRVPVFVSKDDRYFQDKYQCMPKEGYTKIFEKMLENENITIQLDQNIKERLEIKENQLYFDGEKFDGKFIYTGAVDELFDFKYGELPYRSLHFEFESIPQEYYQPVGTVNYPTKEDKFTRITEYKHMTMEDSNIPNTTIMREYPCRHDRTQNTIPYYPIENEENLQLYHQYYEEAQKIKNLYLIGRLAQYKYFNMDLVIDGALTLYETLKGEYHG